MNYFKHLLGVTAISLGMIGSASAAMINGQLDFVGYAAVERDNSGYVSIDYLFDPLVVSATGDYANSINFFDTVDVIDPITFSTLSLPTTIWSIDIFSFALSNISINNGTTVGGSGIISATGFDDTDGFWSFTSQGSGDGKFSFSATQVPEPSTVMLLMLGISALVLGRRRAKTNH